MRSPVEIIADELTRVRIGEPSEPVARRIASALRVEGWKLSYELPAEPVRIHIDGTRASNGTTAQWRTG